MMSKSKAVLLAFAGLTSLWSVQATAQSANSQFQFLQNCAGCHQIDGSGFPPDVPNLRRDLAYLIQSEAGRDFITRVPGVSGVPLPVDEVAALLNWLMRSFYSDQLEFDPFSAEEIASGRSRPLYDPVSYREELFPDLYPDAK